MSTRALARVCAVVILGFGWAAVWWRIWLMRHAAGRESFLAAEARRFDTFYPRFEARFVTLEIVTAIIAIGTIIVIYELLAFGIYKIIALKKPSRDARKT